VISTINCANFEHNQNYQTASILATYKPGLPRSQITKLYIAENQLYLSGH